MSEARLKSRAALKKLNERAAARRAQQEFERLNVIYQGDPERWYVERFGGRVSDIRWSQWPEYANHIWDATPDPFLRAMQALSEFRSVGIESATGTGKTFIVARIVYWFLDVFPDSLVVTTAPKEQQLKTLLWGEISSCFGRFRKIRPAAEMFNLRIVPDGSKVSFGTHMNNPSFEDDDEYSNLHQAIGVVAGVKAGEESATKMQGFHRKYMLFVVEEAAGVPHAVMNAIKNTVTGDYNPVIAIGNPDSVTDALHQFCEQKHVEHIRISGYDHPNIVCGRTLIHGAVSQKSINIRRDEYGDESNFFRSRVRGIAPMESSDSLIKMEWIMGCWIMDESYLKKGRILHDNISRNALGVDVANSIVGDAAAIAAGVKNEMTYLKEFQCPNASAIADNLTKDVFTLEKEKRPVYNIPTMQELGVLNGDSVGVDAVGIGTATVQRFEELEFKVAALAGFQDENCIPLDEEGKLLYSFASLRAQMYWQMRLDLINREIFFSITDSQLFRKLAKQLTMPRYVVSNTQIVLEKKEDIKKRMGGESPNLADVVVYWNWRRKNRSRYYSSITMPFI